MPAESEKQRRFMGADYARAKAGEKTKTGMSAGQLRDFAKKSKKQSNKPAPKPGHTFARLAGSPGVKGN